MEYQIEIKEYEPVTVAFLHYRGRATEASKYFPKVFMSIKGQSCGAPFLCGFNTEPDEIVDIEVCVPTTQSPSSPGIAVKELPRFRALSVTHIGSYETMQNAYIALNQYAAQNGLKIHLPYREIYIKGPGMMFKGNPNNYITEIAIPLVDDHE